MSRRIRQTIAVDCDDVIANINDAIREFVNETYGETHTAEEYKVTGSYKRYWDRIWGTSDGESSDRFVEFVASGRMAKLEQVPGAIKVLTGLKQNFKLVMMTARGAAEADYTHKWLETNAPGLFDDVTFMHLWDRGDKKTTKAEICQEIGADYLIDDNYDHCRIAAECGVCSLLFGDYGWNRGLKRIDNMTKVNDWDEVKRFFDEQRS